MQVTTLASFPKVLKRAKDVPIHKKGAKNIASNYRSISILIPFSIIKKKLIYKRLEKFFDKHKILSYHQFGFLKIYSTTLAGLNLL